MNASKEQVEVDMQAKLYEALVKEREKRESKDRRVAALILKHDLEGACEVLKEVGGLN